MNNKPGSPPRQRLLAFWKVLTYPRLVAIQDVQTTTAQHVRSYKYI